MQSINKKRTYIKISTPAGKKYQALTGNAVSKRSFKTASSAEEYAAAWKDRYSRLKTTKLSAQGEAGDR